MRSVQVGATAAVLLLIGGATSWANLLVNGSFEQAGPLGLPTGTGLSVGAGNASTIPGWTVIGGHAADGAAWLSNGNPFGPTTPFGSYFLDLTGYGDVFPYYGVSQTIATTAGASYTLSFDLGVDQADTRYNGPIGVRASAGSATQDFVGVTSAGAGSQWTGLTLGFTATSSSTVISILGLQAHGAAGATGGGQYIGLDNVSVDGTTTPPPPISTPEPASLLVLTAGLAALGLRRCQRA